MVFDLPLEYLEKQLDRIYMVLTFPTLLYPRNEEIDKLRSFEFSESFYRNVFRQRHQTNSYSLPNYLKPNYFNIIWSAKAALVSIDSYPVCIVSYLARVA